MFKQTKPAALPTFAIIDDPDYAEWKGRIQSLRDQQRKLTDEQDAIYRRLASRSPSPDHALTDSVAALLGDADYVRNPGDGELDTRSREIAAEIKDVRAAIGIAEQRLMGARYKASAAICSALRPDYANRVAALAKALVAAHEANCDLIALTDRLEDGDVAWSGALPPMPASRMVGSPRDKHSALAQWIKDAVAAGFVKKEDVPEALK